MALEITRKITTEEKLNPTPQKELEKKKEVLQKSSEASKVRVDNILSELGDSKTGIGMTDEVDAGTLDIESSLSKDSPLIIKGFSAILMGAINAGATDIHIEAFENDVRIRYRIDGELTEVKSMGRSVLNALVSRVKILSNLDIAERRLPQDGRMKMKILGRDIDFRVAIMPTIYGEKVAIRILDKGAVDMKIDKIGFTEEEQAKIIKSISAPYGIILITGPTGSGKSTTLYSILNYLNKPNVNISTVEDPVEYNIDGINQVQAKAEIGLTFAAALRQFLRQDPDIIMLGEIRDGETSEIAIKAALTGHLVLSTLHTNDAPSTIHRLLNMGVESFLISAAIEMIISQRLMRRVCSKCKVVDENAARKLIILGQNPEEYKDKVFYTGGTGPCEACGGSGYKGRTAVHEILVMSDELRLLVDEKATLKEIGNMAKKQGMLTLKEDGIVKCIQGITTLDELLKTCQ